MRGRIIWIPAILAVILGSGVAEAAPITTFGDCAGGYGGSGIPTGNSVITNEGDLTLCLSATPRFANPALTNNGVDTFYAQAGGDVLDGAPSYAMWNFDWHVESSSTAGNGYFVELLYDSDPGVNTPIADMGRINFFLPAGTTAKDSYNLGMPFLYTAGPIITPPVFSPFDPTVAGEYSFLLRAFTFGDNGGRLTTSSMNVIVEGERKVPEPASLSLLGLGLFFSVTRMRRRFISTK